MIVKIGHYRGIGIESDDQQVDGVERFFEYLAYQF